MDKRQSASAGRAIEVVGYIDPLTKRKSLEKERILHWIKNGAQPSDTVHNLLVSEKIIEAGKIKKFSVTKRAKAESAKAAEAAKAAAPAAAGAAPAEPATPVAEAPTPEAPKPEEKPAETPKPDKS